MVKSNLVYLKRLHNQVFPVAYENICARLEGEEFSVESVQQSFDSAESLINELRFLQNMQIPHPLTETITQQRDDRHQYVLSLKSRVASFMKSPIAAERNAAKTLQVWLYGFREFYKNASINGQTGMINTMSKNINESSVLQNAAETLNLNVIMDSLVSITTDIWEKHQIRLNDKKAALLKAKKMREIAFKRMTTLWKSIELAIELGTGEVGKYTDYLNEINLAMAEYKALYLSKMTRRINAAQEAEDEIENAAHENGVHINSTNGEGANRSMPNFIPINGVEAHNELPAEQAAMRSKTINGGMVNTIPVNGNQEHGTIVKPLIVNTEHNLATNGSGLES